MGYMDEMWRSAIVVEERKRLERYAQAWDAYFGRLPQPLVVKPGKPDDNVQTNFARVVVDSTVAFLFGKEPVFDLAGSEQPPSERWLEECWRVNRKMQLLQKVATNGAVCGHAFIKINPPARPGGYPRLINLSPEYVAVVCDPDDIDTVWRYIIQYPAVGVDGERLVIRQTVEREGGGWSVTDEVSVNDGRFETRSSILWPWDWPPIVDCQNLPSPNEYYGIADIEEDVIALNRAVNFTLSNLQRIIRYHAHPKTWGKGFRADELKIGVDETIILPGQSAELHNLEMQSDLSSSLELYRRLKEALHETTQTPEVATGKLDSAGALSGTALQILYQPLVQKTEAKRLTYGDMLVELNRRLLEMAGYGPDNLTALQWPEVLPRNAMEERQVALMDRQLGASDDTILTRLGYDADEERAKRDAGGDELAEQLLGAFDRGQ